MNIQRQASKSVASPGGENGLAPFLDQPVHVLVHDATLLKQLRIILPALKFSNIIYHDTADGYQRMVVKTARQLIDSDGVFLINPPEYIHGKNKTAVKKGLPDFFSSVSHLLEKARRDKYDRLSRCVPIFPEIQYTQKRENTLVALAEYGITGAFILKEQDPDVFRSKQNMEDLRQLLVERLEEVKGYMLEFLPNRENAVVEMTSRKEELDLTSRQAEADRLLKEAMEYKQGRSFEQAIKYFKKAIELMPMDPQAYLESGRVYVRIRKYPSALLRFKQAEEVAIHIPEPNKEIANVRMLQAKERIENGESAQSTKVKDLLHEAVNHYEIAVDKASKIKLEHHARRRDIRVESIARVAGDIFKQDLESVLGKRNAVVLLLSDVARRAISLLDAMEETELGAPKLILMGLAAMDQGDFKEAERLLYQAAEDPNYFAEACNELIILGTIARQRMSPDVALFIYDRLLQYTPPNRASVYYNIAVAHAAKEEHLDALGALMQALFLDPLLAEEEEFYRNEPLMQLLEDTLQIFDAVEHSIRKGQANILTDNERRDIMIQEKIEHLILEDSPLQVLDRLQKIATLNKNFFKRRAFFSVPYIREFIANQLRNTPGAAYGKTDKQLHLLETLNKAAERLEQSQAESSFYAYKAQASHCLAVGAKKIDAVALLTKALISCSYCTERAEFFANNQLLELTLRLHKSLASVKRVKLP